MAVLSQHRSLDISHWILTPGTNCSPSRHLTVGSSPCYPAALGQSFLPGRFFYSLLQMLAQALTAPGHHLTAEFMCSFPGFSTFFLLHLLPAELSAAARGPQQRQTRFLQLIPQGHEGFLCPQQVDQQQPSWALFLAHSLDLSSHPTSTPSSEGTAQSSLFQSDDPFPLSHMFSAPTQVLQ